MNFEVMFETEKKDRKMSFVVTFIPSINSILNLESTRNASTL
jgi:hypothetical protein